CIASSRATAAAYASSTPVVAPSTLIAFATSHTDPSRWSTTARSTAGHSVSSGTSSSSGAFDGSVGSHWYTKSQPTEPTRPLVSGGSPAIAGVRSTSSAPPRTSRGLPSVGTPVGTSPCHATLPSRTVSVALELTPTKE